MTKDHEEYKPEICESFPVSTIAQCYCRNSFISSLSYGNTQQLVNTVCESFYTTYNRFQSFIYVPVITTVVINFVMRHLIKILVNYESPMTIDECQVSLLNKVFLSNFITLSLLILIANGNLGNYTNDSSISAFSGPYDDFSRSWYGNIGFYIYGAFVLQGLFPILVSLFSYKIYYPLLRRHYLPKVK
jgi:hypothetical protein